MEKQFKVLYPGRKVPLSCGLTAVVYPLGFKHLRRFSKDVAGALAMLGTLRLPKEGDATSRSKALMGQVLPFALEHLLVMLGECVVFVDGDNKEVDVTMDDLAHWDLPALIMAWFEESFGTEDKRRPWIEAVEMAMTKVTKKPFKMSEIFSNSSSPADTTSS